MKIQSPASLLNQDSTKAVVTARHVVGHSDYGMAEGPSQLQTGSGARSSGFYQCRLRHPTSRDTLPRS